MLAPEFGASDESLEVALFGESEIPWADIAFPSIHFSLRRYLADRSHGDELLHFHDIHEPPPR